MTLISMLKPKQNFVIAILLVTLILACIPLNTYADISPGTQTQIITEDGITYKIITKQTPAGKTVTIINNNDLDKVVVVATEDTVKATTYEYEGNDLFGNKDYSIEATSSGIIPEDTTEAKDQVTAQLNWNSKTREIWSGKYWYQYGSSPYGNTYMQIGSTATYQIPYYKLSYGKRAECNLYASYIKDCNAHMNKAKAFLMSGDIAVATIVLVGIAAELPVAVVVGALASTVGIGVPGLADLVDSYYSYKSAAEEYFIIRNYGLTV